MNRRGGLVQPDQRVVRHHKRSSERQRKRQQRRRVGGEALPAPEQRAGARERGQDQRANLQVQEVSQKCLGSASRALTVTSNRFGT